jgi:hypothetical protein
MPCESPEPRAMQVLVARCICIQLCIGTDKVEKYLEFIECVTVFDIICDEIGEGSVQMTVQEV